MAIFGELNWLAIMVAAVVSVVAGFVWWSGPVFGARWTRLVKAYGQPYVADPTLDPNKPADPLLQILRWLVGLLLNAIALAIAIRLLGIADFGGVILLALFVSAGFAGPVSSWPAVFARWPWELWLINNGFFLVIQIVMGTILLLWQ